MSQRDLTMNSSARGNNPFADSDSRLENSYTSSESGLAPPTGQYPQVSAYSAYTSQNGTSSNLLNDSDSDRAPGAAFDRRSSNQTPTGELPDLMQVPLEFDRYPSMAGLRVVSSTLLASQFNTRDFSGLSNDGLSAKLSNPFVSNVDFSPFGGYPASLFPLHVDEKEEDDYLHNPDPIADAEYDKNRFWYDLKTMDRRLGCGLVSFAVLFVFCSVIFVVLPVLTYSGVTDHVTPESYEVLTNYEYPLSAAIRTSLIDPDTPTDAYYRESLGGENWTLTFSDEFNAEGRTFYDGDDQFFQAVDIHYAATKDLEWYDPDAVITANGTLQLRMDAYKNHGLYYRSGMIQLWNKLCFTQGIIDVSTQLPNYGNVTGLWPGLWTMGNLGRPGYLATTEGVWPYTYDSCDAGITANQSSPDGISYLPGQRLNVCTCNGEDHPNQGTGRGAPEIDILEGEMDTTILVGVASQSYQVAPMDVWYMPDYNFVQIYNSEVTTMNTYAGGPLQQAVSATSTLNTTWYNLGDGDRRYQRYGFEYLNDDDTGYITWYVGDDPMWTVHAYALGPNGNVGFRRISKEPMSIVLNLGISNNWAYIDWASIKFPATMFIDYVRIYQPPDAISMTCDPEDYPTYDYIEDHLNAYLNVNLTSWSLAGYGVPKNLLVNGCST